MAVTITCAECGRAAEAYRVRWGHSQRTLHLCAEHAAPMLELIDKYSPDSRSLRRYDNFRATIEDIERMKQAGK